MPEPSNPLKRHVATFSAVRRRDLAYALDLVDEVSPAPAGAHTALLILRDLIADLSGVPADDLARVVRSAPSTPFTDANLAKTKTS